MQIGPPPGNQLLSVLIAIVLCVSIALLVYRIFGLLVDRRTTELRQRVALLEHQVERLEDERDDQ